MNTIKFNNADELVAYCIENNMLAGQVWVDHNPEKKGERTLLWFCIDCDGELSTYILNQLNINNVDYINASPWHTDYTGTFELVLPYNQFTKPEVYAVGDTVEVLENAKECDDYIIWSQKHKNMLGKQLSIIAVQDHRGGICYSLVDAQGGGGYNFPHYCVRKIENPIKEMTQAQIEQELGYKVKIIE
jgi:hypothetical protein